MKNLNESNDMLNVVFFSMLFSMTLLCIFLYFGGEEMSCCEKICASILIVAIAVFGVICIFKINVREKLCYKDAIYVEDAGLYVLYKDKNKPKICQIKYFEKLEDLQKNNPKITRIHIKSGSSIDKEIFDLIENNDYEFSIENSDATIVIKNKNETDNSEKAEKDNESMETPK